MVVQACSGFIFHGQNASTFCCLTCQQYCQASAGSSVVLNIVSFLTSCQKYCSLPLYYAMLTCSLKANVSRSFSPFKRLALGFKLYMNNKYLYSLSLTQPVVVTMPVVSVVLHCVWGLELSWLQLRLVQGAITRTQPTPNQQTHTSSIQVSLN